MDNLVSQEKAQRFLNSKQKNYIFTVLFTFAYYFVRWKSFFKKTECVYMHRFPKYNEKRLAVPLLNFACCETKLAGGDLCQADLRGDQLLP